ncbi:MAG: histidinol dehydrogenase [Candidatus Rokubacteria bacterium 13_1_40CM_68_15]|nr:MAG: histidinol dehydrogenase [Candidatus Rokubacteria bacterium 13_1_40CM_68_15]
MREYLKKAVPRPPEDDAAVRQTVSDILDAVRDRGDKAVREWSERLDRWSPPAFRLSQAEIESAIARVSVEDRRVIDYCRDQVAAFARRQRESLREFDVELQPGIRLGQRLIPVQCVGAYVPGGRYPLVASALMSIVTAKVAGVERIVACSPPTPPDTTPRGIYPATLYAMFAAGADEIYCIGGVQALGAMAYGTGTLPSVAMVVGPGNQYVAEAKRQIFGAVGIDLLAGPTEILVIADDSADPGVVACDLLGQAEHGPTSPAILITTSRALGEAVVYECERQIPTLGTREVVREAWDRNGEVIVVGSDEEAAALADQYAPEHLEVQTRDLDWYLGRLRNYGSLFLGEESTVAYSDKTIGPNHILPTGRAARYTGGLWVGKFIKTVTWQRLSREASGRVAPTVARVCEIEGMLAHKATADLREERYR